jgi:hypothetical protein
VKGLQGSLSGCRRGEGSDEIIGSSVNVGYCIRSMRRGNILSFDHRHGGRCRRRGRGRGRDTGQYA